MANLYHNRRTTLSLDIGNQNSLHSRHTSIHSYNCRVNISTNAKVQFDELFLEVPVQLVDLHQNWCFLLQNAISSPQLPRNESFFKTTNCFWKFKVTSWLLFPGVHSIKYLEQPEQKISSWKCCKMVFRIILQVSRAFEASSSFE